VSTLAVEATPLPTFRSDREAEEFVEKADLTHYDLSGMRPVKLEFKKKKVVAGSARAPKKSARPQGHRTSKTRS
jgi:CopG antitoxin of type II toxin-antitoxin system